MHTCIQTYTKTYTDSGRAHPTEVVKRRAPLSSSLQIPDHTYTHTYIHTYIHSHVHAQKHTQVVGGRIRLMASGAAPLSPDLHKFLTQVFGCPVLQGYGMTENCAAAVVQPLGYRLGGAWAS